MAERKYKTLGEFLTHAQIRYSSDHGRLVSDAEFAKWLGVSNMSYSQWKNDYRNPVGANLHKVAAKLGPMVYDLTGQPRLMPEDPILKYAAENWHTLDEETKLKVEQVIHDSLANPIESTI